VQAAARAALRSVNFFPIRLGAAFAALPGAHRERLVPLFDSFFEAMMRLTSGVMLFLPLGVFGLITRLVGTSGLDTFRALGLYMLTIAMGLTFHLFVTLPLLLLLLGRINPLIHFKNMTEPLLMAFHPSSSAATLPVTITAVEKRAGVSNKVTSFVLPMGATVNMDGTALSECAGVHFLAQGLGVGLGFGEQRLVVHTALLASIGAAAVPSAGLVINFIVLEAVNLRGPEVNAIVGAMLAIDRPLAMYRTSVNVFSDSCGAAIVARHQRAAMRAAA